MGHGDRRFSFLRSGWLAAALSAAVLPAQSQVTPEKADFAQSRNLAPGFGALPKGSKIVVMPVDIELFSLSAGGVAEPRADWTESATKNFRTALLAKQKELGLGSAELSDKDADEFGEINTLHGAVARAIAIHHFGNLALPTKDRKLDWSLGDAVRPIRARTGADYAIFSWVRDSYASDERKAAMVMLALVGVGVGGGVQNAYASLVDLTSGRVLWFNRLVRQSGDLRQPAPAAETVGALMTGFPIAK